MKKEERVWHPNFYKYMDEIVNHPNYKGLRIKKTSSGRYAWITTKQSVIGTERLLWCKNKAKQLGLPLIAGVSAKVMFELHPTKQKVCQVCGKEMSLYYYYPNKLFLKPFNTYFNSNFTTCDHISDIWDILLKHGHTHTKIAEYLIKKGQLQLNPTNSKAKIITALEFACRNGKKKCLGPGAMSDFPDRFDGFHSYNRCCRSMEDKGRHSDNMKLYTKDRRAYEYWSDGNIHADNEFMGSDFFNGYSADHIGPISLGFIHDPHYLQKMSSSNNSTKRDRLQYEDIVKIIHIENKTSICPISWYSKLIWEYIKISYTTNKEKIETLYRDALKQNMMNFMYVLYTILKKCPNEGELFLIDIFLTPNYHSFNYSYTFNECGEIIKKTRRHHTDRSKNEFKRYCRIAIDSVDDYVKKNNRKIKSW